MAENIEFNIGSKGADVASRGLLQASGASEKLRASMGMLSQGSNLAAAASGRLTSAIGSISTAAKGLQAALGPIAVLFTAFKGVQAVGAIIGDSAEAYKIQEKAARGASDAQLDYSAKIQRVLGIGDEVSLGLMKQATVLGISKDKTDEATLAAIGLSKATGAGLDESLKKVNQAIRGNASALGEAIPGLQNLATEEQKLAAISELANRGLATQKADMASLEGIQTRATNSYGDLAESIGAILAPVRALTSHGFAVMAETMQSVLAPAVNFAKAAMDKLPTAMDYISQAVVGGITFLEVAFGNWGAIVKMEFDFVQLKVIEFAENLRHRFTVEIPAYASWFAANFTNILRDGFMLATRLAMAAARAIGESFANVWDWVASGFQGGIDGLMASQAASGAKIGQAFMQGLKFQTESLPEIMARQITEKEKDLAQRIGATATMLGQEFNDKFAARMAAVRENFGDFSAKVSLTQDKAAMTGLGQQKAQQTELKAVESRLLTRGRADDPNAKIADNTAETVKKLEMIHEQLRGNGSGGGSNTTYTPGVVGL